MAKKITNIRYLDQRGLKTFHDATGWVEISIKHNDTFMVYDNSPIKFVNGGEVLIDGTKETIEIGKSYMYNVGTEIVNKRGSDLILNIFVKHYNQLIQNELKTNKLRLPGATSQVVLGDGSLKGLDDLVVGSATNATKSNQLYISKITSSIPPGVQQSKTYNFFLSGFTDNSAGYKNLKGFDNVYVRVNESNGNISESELVVPGISIEDGDENKVLQGNGQPIAKMGLTVGRADQVKISNISEPTNLVGLTYPLLGSLDGGSLDDPYNSLVNLNDYVFYSIVNDPTSNTISKVLFVADGKGENNIPLRGTIYGNLDGNATSATKADNVRSSDIPLLPQSGTIQYPLLCYCEENEETNQNIYIAPYKTTNLGIYCTYEYYGPQSPSKITLHTPALNIGGIEMIPMDDNTISSKVLEAFNDYDSNNSNK